MICLITPVFLTSGVEISLSIMQTSTYNEFPIGAPLKPMTNMEDSYRVEKQTVLQGSVGNVAYWKSLAEDRGSRIDQLLEKVGQLHETYLEEREQLISNYEANVERLKKTISMQTDEANYLNEKLKFLTNIKIKTKNNQKNELNEAKIKPKSVKNVESLLPSLKSKETDSRLTTLANLDDVTKTLFKENQRLLQNMNICTEENKKLKSEVERMSEEVASLRHEKEIADMLVRKKIAASRHDKTTIQELQQRISDLERSLSSSLNKFELEQNALVLKTTQENKDNVDKVERFQRMLQLKNKELKRLKKRSSILSNERSDVEEFILEALKHVRREISSKRAQARRDIEIYENGQLMGFNRYKRNSSIRNYPWEQSSNVPLLKAQHNRGALIPTGIDSEEEIDISQMTWEEKETVLQHLLLNLDVFRRQAQNHHPNVKTKVRKTQQLINVETRNVPEIPTEKFESVFLTETEF